MFTTVMLDVDNTLLDFDRCAVYAMSKAMSDWKMEYTDEIFEVFCEVNRDVWQQLEKGILTEEELYRIRWQLIFDRLGIQRNGAEFEHLFLKYLKESHETVEGAMELLQYLSAKYIICIVSNAPYDQQMGRLKAAGMLPYIQYIFISERLGCSKPGKGFFDACFEQLGSVNKEEVMIIGDSMTADIAGGVTYGLKTC